MQLDVQVAKIAKALEVEAQKVVKWAALKLHARIVERTPVDTGRCRASWAIVEGYEPDTTVAPETYRGGAAGALMDAAQKRSAVGDAFAYVISNNLPYVGGLEYGRSKQAPHGMVRVAIAELKTEMGVMARGRRV